MLSMLPLVPSTQLRNIRAFFKLIFPSSLTLVHVLGDLWSSVVLIILSQRCITLYRFTIIHYGHYDCMDPWMFGVAEAES